MTRDGGGSLPLETALLRFEERLERAQVASQGDPSHLPPGSTPARYAQQIWIKATHLLLEDLGLGRFSGLPLDMLQALGDLDRGNTLPLVRASDQKVQHVTMEEARMMARAAKALDLLSAHDRPERQSRKKAANTVFAALPRPSPLKTPKAIVELRENIQRQRAPADVLRLWRMPLPAEAGETPAEQAAWLLGMLAN